MELKTIIAGAGIGGLSAALGLARVGCRVVILERSPALGEIGAGIQLGPNAFFAFDRLGILEAVKTTAVFIDQLRLMDALSATEITHISLGPDFQERFGYPYAVVHRGELHRAILTACLANPLIEIRTDCEVTGFSQDATSVEAILASGQRVAGDLLVGADGLRSAIRTQVVGDGAPRVSGHTTYRSTIPTEQMPENLRWNAATLWAGPNCHIVHYPLSGWKTFNLAVTHRNDAKVAAAGEAVSDEEVLAAFAPVHDLAKSILRRGRNWKRWVLCDREPVMNWVDGRVALLGDAAHPMMQYFAQGACQAVEDAVCLMDMIGSSASVEEALGEYCSRRVLRNARIQLESRALGDHVYHAAGAHAALRTAIMSAKTSKDYWNHLDWLYGAPLREAIPTQRSAQNQAAAE